MSTRLGAAPRTPTNNDRRMKIRRFGTVLSVNSPVTTPSMPKNKKTSTRIRGETLHHLTPIPSSSSSSSHHPATTTTILEENEEEVTAIPFQLSESATSPSCTTGPSSVTTYAVTFDAGPIGLQIDPETWCVQQVIGQDSPAAMIGTIQMGDVVIDVNGISTNSHKENSNDIFDVLQDVTIRRKITFQRNNNSKYHQGEHSSAFTIDPDAALIVPTNDVENRKPIPGTARLKLATDDSNLAPAPRSLNFGTHQKATSVQSDATKKTREIISPTMKLNKTKEASIPQDEAPNELKIANHQIQQLQARLAAIEAENELLRSQQQKLRFDSPPPTQPLHQPFSAIREMEYNMRIKSLEDQLKQTIESRAKIKEHNKRMNQMLVHQSENYQQILAKKEQALQDVILSSKETMNELELTRKELTTTTKQWNDDVDALSREKDQLHAILDQKSIDLERHIVAKANSDVRLQQLEDKCTDFNEQVQRLQYKLDEAECHAQQTNDEFLQIIRTKDEEMEQLRIDMVNVQTINDKLHADMTEKDATIRQVRADMEQLSVSKQSMSTEIMNLSSTLEMTYNEKERLLTQLTQVESKVTDRNSTIDALKGTIKSIQDEVTVSLNLKEDELLRVGDSLKVVLSEKDLLHQQLQDLQLSVLGKNQHEMQLRNTISKLQVELDDLRQSTTIEKCSLLKQLEALEGEFIVCQKTIQMQNDTIAELRAKLDTRTSERNDALSELDKERTSIALADAKIQMLEVTIAELNDQLLTKENEYISTTEQLKTHLNTATQGMTILKKSNICLNEEVVSQRKLLKSSCLTELQLQSDQKQQRTKIQKLEQCLQHEKEVNAKNLQNMQSEMSSKNDMLALLSSERNAALSKVASLESDIVRNTNKISQIESALEAEVLRSIQMEVQHQIFAESANVYQQELKDKLLESENRLRTSNNEYNNATETIEKVKAELEKLHEVCRVKGEENLDLSAQLSASASCLEYLECSTRREKDELSEKIRMTVAELADTKQKLELSKNLQSDAIAELECNRTIVTNLTSDMSSLQDSLKEFRSTAEKERASFILEKTLMDDQVKDLVTQLNQESLQLQQSQSELQLLNDEVCELRDCLKSKEERLLEKQSEIEHVSAMLKDVSNALQISESNFSNMSTKAENAELTAMKLKESMASQQDDLETTSMLATKMKSENDSLMTRIYEMETEFDLVTNNLKQLAMTKQADDETMKHLKESILGLQSKYDSDCAAKDLTIERCSLERDESTAECSILRGFIENGKDIQNRLEYELNQLRLQLTNTEADFQRSDELFAGQASELEKFHRKFTEQKTRADKLLSELKQSESSIDSLSRLLDSTNAQVALLKKSVLAKTKEYENKLDAMKVELNHALKANQSLNEDNKKHLEFISNLEVSYSNAKETVDILTQCLSTLESKNSAIQSTATANEREFLVKQELLQSEICDLNSSLEALEKRLVELTEKVALAEYEKLELSTQLSENSNELMRMKQDVSSLQTQLDESKQHEIAVVTKVNESWSIKLDNLSEENRSRLLAESEKSIAAEHEINALRSMYDTTLSEMELLKVAVCKMKADNDALSKNAMAFELDIAKANERLTVSETQVREKSSLLTIAEGSIAEANIQISDLKERIETLLCDSSAASSSMAYEMTQLKEISEFRQAECDEVKTKYKTLQTKLTEKDFELEKAHEELRSQTETVNELTASAAASQWVLECKIEALNAEVFKYRELSSALDSECKNLKLEIKTLIGKIDSMNEQHTSAISLFDMDKYKLLEHEKELEDSISAEMNRTTQLTEELDKLKLERNRELKDTAANTRQLEETIRSLQYEANLLSKRQEDWMEDREIERDQFRQCREELQDATTKMSNWEDLCAQMKSEVDSLTLQIDQARIEYEANIEQISRSHASDICVLRQENDRLQSRIKEMSTKNNLMTETLRLLEDQLATLQSEQNNMVTEKEDLLSIIEEKNVAIQSLQSELQDRSETSLDAISVDSSLQSLSKCELRHRCSVLQDELVNAENCLKASNDAVNRRSDHVVQLSDDLNTMSNEIARLVTANEMLEVRLKKVSSLYASSEETITKSHHAINGLQAQLKHNLDKLEEMSSQNESLVDQLQVINIHLKSERRSFETEKNAVEEDLLNTKQELEESIARRDRAEKSLSDTLLVLVSARENEENLHATIKQLEQETQRLTMKFADFTKESNAELTRKVSYYDKQISDLETECAVLRSRVSEFESEVKSKELTIKDKTEREHLLIDDLTRQRQNAMAAEQQREGIVEKLTEATRVVASQRAAIKKLELSVAESDRTIAELLQRIDTLQATNQQRENQISDSELQHIEHFRDIKSKLNVLDERRVIVTQDANNARAELRKVQQNLSEVERANILMQKQLKDLSSINDLTKAQIVDIKDARDDAVSSIRKLTNELDNKQMEIDHMKAKFQVSAATTARLKANFLLHELTPQTESESDMESKIGEIEKLRGELKDSSSRLTSISEVCRSQEQALRFSQKFESQLVRFIEEIIYEMDNVLGNIALRTESLYEHAEQYQIYASLKALDLAGFDHAEPTSDSLRTTLDSLSVLIPHAATQLDERRAQLGAWKEQRSDQYSTSARSDQYPSNTTTPRSKRLDTVPDTPEILDTLSRIRNILETDILSPLKIRTVHSDQLDVEFFKQVIHTLEGNIDVLLQDLQTANAALQEKDNRISELETFFALKKSVDENSHTPTNNPSHESSTGRHESDSHEEQSQSTQQRHSDFDGRKRAAGLLLLHAIEGRNNAAKAIAFRRWSCQTSAMRAIAKHGHTATALAQQLEETREKLLILKRHLKKARRTGGGGSCSGGGVGTLDRIPEDESEV